MNCKDIAGSTPRLPRGASCSQPSHPITMDMSLVLPKPRLQTLLCPFLALLFLIPPTLPPWCHSPPYHRAWILL